MGYSSVPTNLGASTQAGRPARVKPIVLRTPDQASGFEWAGQNLQPEVIKRVQQQYIKNQQLPPGLAPNYTRLPNSIENRRRLSISRGWRKPRGAT